MTDRPLASPAEFTPQQRAVFDAVRRYCESVNRKPHNPNKPLAQMPIEDIWGKERPC